MQASSGGMVVLEMSEVMKGVTLQGVKNTGLKYYCKVTRFGLHTFVFPFNNQTFRPWSMHAKSDILHLFPSGSGEKERPIAASDKLGSALGPDWHEGLSLKGTKEVWS